MTQIRKMKIDNKHRGTAYSKLFGDERLGSLIGQVHAASIRHGHALEDLIALSIPGDLCATLEDVCKGNGANHEMIVYHPEMPKSGAKEGIVADFAIFWPHRKRFLVVELKAGTVFDTRKSSAIKADLQTLTEYLTGRTGFSGDFAVCGFGALTRQELVKGFKGRLAISEVLTGIEFCNAVHVDYEEIMQTFKEHQLDNKDYFFGRVEAIQNDTSDDQYFLQVRGLADGQLSLL